MCGLVAILNYSSDGEQIVRMAESGIASISHRGPDFQSAERCSSRSAFAHARLSILDLSPEANMPFWDADMDLCIVFNGQIYNHEDLRNELRTHGINFRTRSDTEVIVEGFRVWGKSVVEKLNGMFAFIIFRKSTSEVFVARDRLGIKPLYYLKHGNTLYFGSEVKALAVASGQKLALDRDAFDRYMAYQNFFGEQTLFKGVELFPSASFASFHEASPDLEPRRYWQAEFRPTEESDTEILHRLEEALNAAMQRHTQADVQVNSFLSGGIDSCAIAKLGAEHRSDLATFTCGFDIDADSATGAAFDERQRARLMARHVNSVHRETELTGQIFFDHMHEWARHAEEPRVGSSFPNFWVSKLGAAHGKVCLSGTGGDELFGGYPWRYRAAMRDDWDEFNQLYRTQWQRMLPAETLSRVMGWSSKKTAEIDAVFDDRLQDCRKRVHGQTNVFGETCLLFELETFLAGLLLIEDKASMAHGLEVRVPLLDSQIVDLALQIPFASKVATKEYNKMHEGIFGVGGGRPTSFSSGKKILRQVLQPHVPDEIYNARKQGFSPPFELWCRNELKSYLIEDVFSPTAPLSDLLDINIAKQLLQQHLDGTENNRLFLWGALATHLCVETYLT